MNLLPIDCIARQRWRSSRKSRISVSNSTLRVCEGGCEGGGGKREDGIAGAASPLSVPSFASRPKRGRTALESNRWKPLEQREGNETQLSHRRRHPQHTSAQPMSCRPLEAQHGRAWSKGKSASVRALDLTSHADRIERHGRSTRVTFQAAVNAKRTQKARV